MHIPVAKESHFYITELIKNLSALGGQTTDDNDVDETRENSEPVSTLATSTGLLKIRL